MIKVLEWLGTALLIIGTAVNSFGYYPQGPIILIVAECVWLAVSIAWKKPSLIIINVLMTAVGIVGVSLHYLG